MTAYPTGTVTFLFTDIAGSTARWERDRAAMSAALARHNAILERAIAAHGGFVFKTVGDAFCAAFAQAADAVEAAIDAQRALAIERWDEIAPGFEPLRVRIGVHTGLAELQDGDYFGRPVNRVARLMAAAHGGQILLSLASQQLVRDALPKGCELVDLGVHRLKDLEHTEHLFRLVAPGVPDIDTPPDTAARLPAGERVAVAGALADAACPYRGLHAFREADAAFFFGREAFTELLVDAVAAAPMVGVIGPSGSGKSSVVFAGLVPRLRGNGAVAKDWTVVDLRLGARPFHALAGALLPLYERDDLTETDRLTEVVKLATVLRDGTVSPADVLARIGDRRPHLGRLLLVADQFEELYTLCPDDADQRAFQDLLFAAAFEPGPGVPLSLALTLRADFMGHALAYRPFADAIQKHDVKLGPMTRDELARAVRLPAEAQGRAFESGLVERIVDDVGDKAGSLPLLEFALTKLWDEQHAGWLTHEAYERIGRVEGAVARHADAVFDALPEPERERARRVFVQLVQPGEGTEDTRRLATRDELGDDWTLASRLADARLVTTGRDEAGRETAEVVHEALIRSWQRLREWMNADRRFRAWQERLRFGLRQWEAAGCDEGALLRGVPLAEAEQWVRERGAELAEAERAFVAAGTAEHARADRDAARIARRTRRLAYGVALATTAGMVVALFLARGLAENASRLADLARAGFARELASVSAAAAAEDPELAALLALEALSTTQAHDGSVLPEAESALHRAVQRLHVERVLRQPGVRLYDVEYSPDGSLVATAGNDQRITLWDAATGDPLRELRGHTASVRMVAFSPDGARIASASFDGTVRLWDVATGRLERMLCGHVGDVFAVAWDPNGTRLASGGEDGVVRVWPSDGHAPIVELPFGAAIDGSGAVAIVYGVAFHPDGNLLAAHAAADASNLRVWELSSAREVARLDTGLYGNVAFSAGGALVVVAGGSDDLARFAQVWDWGAGQRVCNLSGHRQGVFSAAFLPDGGRVATVSHDGTLRLWNARSCEALFTIQPGHTDWIFGLAVRPDGLQVASASRDGTTRLVEPYQDKEHVVIEYGVRGRLETSADDRLAAVYDASRDRSGLDDQRSARLFDLATGRAVGDLAGHEDIVHNVAFSADGQRVATASHDGTLRVWSTDSLATIATMGAYTDRVSLLSFDPDGDLLAVTASGRVDRWDVGGPTLRTSWHGPGGDAWFVAGPALETIASVGPGQPFRVHDAATGVVRQTLPLSAPFAFGQYEIAFDRAGTTLTTLSADFHRVDVWDTATWQPVFHLPELPWPTYQVMASWDGRLFATGHADRAVRLWDATGARLRATLAGHLDYVEAIAFAPDDRSIATGDGVGTVSLWDVASGRHIATLAETGSPIADLRFLAGGRRLLVIDRRRAHVLAVPLADVVALARQRLTRGLTDDECRRYLRREACSGHARGDEP